MVTVTDSERRAMLSVVDCLVGRAGRTTLVMALRGSKARRVLQFGAEQARGYGRFAGVPAEDVLARVDALIEERIIALESVDGFPLLTYTAHGLALAERNAAENWLKLVRQHVRAVRAGGQLDLPFVHARMPNRNLRTLKLVIDDIAREANTDWLEFLEAWSAVETKRVRGWLHRIIEQVRRHDRGRG